MVLSESVSAGGRNVLCVRGGRMPLSKEKMREYMRRRRGVNPVNPEPVRKPVVNPVPVNPVNLQCKGCADRDFANKILRAKVLMLEKELVEAKKLIPKKPDSPYRGF